jgi:hypothetical protein
MVNVEESYWSAEPDEEVAGLALIVSGAVVIGYDILTPLAEHLVKIHNAWWDVKVWDSYYDNIEYSILMELESYYRASSGTEDEDLRERGL